VHLGSFTGGQEKCVDISLAVDMLHYATLPQVRVRVRVRGRGRGRDRVRVRVSYP